MNDPEGKKRCEEDDNKLKIDSERKEVKETSDEIRKIWMEKLKMESDLEIRVQKLQLPSQQMVAQMMLIERNKILDEIYIKHGIKFHYLVHAMEHHGLDKDDTEITTYKKSLILEQKRAQQEIEKD